MSRRIPFINLYRRGVRLYVPENSYAHKFFYSKGYRPYDELHPIDFVITPTAMTLDVGGNPTDVLNIVDDKIAIVNKYGDFTLTLKATIPAEIEWEIITWKFQKQVAGELIDCDDTDVTFTPNPADETECEFSIGTIQDEACTLIITAEIEGDYGVIGKGIPVEIEFYDIPKLTIAPTDLMFGGEDILDYDAETHTVSVVDKLGAFTLNAVATILNGVTYDAITWSYSKVIAGELANCDDTTVVITPDAVDITKAAISITTIANTACSVVVNATCSNTGVDIETSHNITVEFSETVI